MVQMSEGTQNMVISSNSNFKINLTSNLTFHFYHGYVTPGNDRTNYKPSFYVEHRPDAETPWTTTFFTADQMHDLLDGLDQMFKLYQACPKDFDAR